MEAALRSKLTDGEVMLREYAWLASRVIFAALSAWLLWRVTRGEGGWAWAVLIPNILAGSVASSSHNEFRDERLSRRPDRST